MCAELTIICVEDAPDQREAMTEWLQFADHVTVVAAANLEEGKRALEAADKPGKPCVLVTDLNYTTKKDKAGFTMIQNTHEHHSSVPCILITGDGTCEVRDWCMQRGVPCFEKGTDLDRLMLSVQTAVTNGPGSGNHAATPKTTSSKELRYA
jgi:DNA-binding NtrC family response regulator